MVRTKYATAPRVLTSVGAGAGGARVGSHLLDDDRVRYQLLQVVDIGKGEARQARRLLADAKLHGHKYAIDAVLAVIARQQKGQVTVFTSDVDALEKLVPDTIVVKKV